MSLTLEAEQRLTKANLLNLFNESRARWQRLAQQSYDFVRRNFPEGATIRQDDVAKALVPLLEVNDALVTYLEGEKLRQNYWVRDFGDLILDRSWDAIT